MLRLSIALLLSTLVGCSSHARRDEPEPFVEVLPVATRDVDILFVVDNSYSMAEEQALLAEGAEGLLAGLADPSTGASLHVGVVSTDMGSGGYPVMTCRDPIDGDGGELQTAGRLEGCDDRYGTPGCGGTCPWLAHTAARPDDGRDPANPPIWEDLGCVASLGTAGCGFEQPLEASFAALTVETMPGKANEGFLRDGSLVVVAYVTDDGDCSISDSAILDPSRDDLGPLDVRCVLHPELLHPVDRYVEALRALRPGRPSLVMAAGIVGLPLDLDPASLTLDDVREVLSPVLDPEDPSHTLPICESPRGRAKPAPRIAELVLRLEGVLGSICAEGWSGTVARLVDAVRRRLGSPCLAVPPGAAGCRVVGTLADDRPCPGSPAALVDLGLDELGRRQCEVPEVEGGADGCPAAGDCGCIGCGLDEPGCAVTTGSCAGGFYRRSGADACAADEPRLTGGDLTPGAIDVRLECPRPDCAASRSAPEIAARADRCDPVERSACGEGATCVRHTDRAVCPGAVTCGRCSRTLASRCPAGVGDEGPLDRPLLGPSGCCLEGFHADEAVGGCAPDGATPCLGAECACASDWDCDDGLPCDGEERCRDCLCAAGDPPSCDDGEDCTDDLCDDEAGGCVHLPRDLDGDGAGDGACGGDDCDDGDPLVGPAVEELCNGFDDDCDGLLDEPNGLVVGHDGHTPRLAWSGEGFAVAYAGPGETVAVAILDGDGRVASTTLLPLEGTSAEVPAIAWAGDRYAVVWDQQLFGHSDLYAATLWPDGEIADGPSLLAPGRDWAHAGPIVWTGFALALAWTDHRGSASEIAFLRLSLDLGPLGDAVVVGEGPGVAMTWTGESFVLAWVGGASGSLAYARLGATGEVELPATDVGVPAFGEVALDWTGSASGALYSELVSSSETRLSFVGIGPDGAALGPSVPLTGAGGTSPSIAWDGDEHVAVTSVEFGSRRDASLVRLTAEGVPLGAPRRLTLSPEHEGVGSTSLAWTGDRLAMAWETSADWQVLFSYVCE